MSATRIWRKKPRHCLSVYIPARLMCLFRRSCKWRWASGSKRPLLPVRGWLIRKRIINSTQNWRRLKASLNHTSPKSISTARLLIWMCATYPSRRKSRLKGRQWRKPPNQSARLWQRKRRRKRKPVRKPRKRNASRMRKTVLSGRSSFSLSKTSKAAHGRLAARTIQPDPARHGEVTSAFMKASTRYISSAGQTSTAPL